MDPPKKQRQAVKIKVPSKEQKKEEDLTPHHESAKPPSDDEHEGMSEEDRLLKERLESQVRHLTDSKSKEKAQTKAVGILSEVIQNSTSSMTSVPKPLKFLRPHYDTLRDFYNRKGAAKSETVKKGLADVLSVLAMTMAEEGVREVLNFKLAGNRKQLGEWGHQYVRAISGEISQEFAHRTSQTPPKGTDDLIQLVTEIVPFLFAENSETEAVDLLFEVNQLERLKGPGLVDENNYERVCLYLIRFAEYLFASEELDSVMAVAYDLYLRQNQLPDALRVAMRTSDGDRIKNVMQEAKKQDRLVEQQLALMLGGSRMFGYEDAKDFELNELIFNDKYWEFFQTLAENLNKTEPKSPENVYKTHLEDDSSSRNGNVESARYNLASSYVNGFVNVGFQKDSLLVDGNDPFHPTKWVYKNKAHGMTAAVASLGLVRLWELGEGITGCHDFLNPPDAKNAPFMAAGALLAIGVVSCGVHDENRQAYISIREKLSDPTDAAFGGTDSSTKVCAMLGLGLAHCGDPDEEVRDLLKGYLMDDDESIAVIATAGLALGMIHAGTGARYGVSEDLLDRLLRLNQTDASQAVARFLQLGLGLLFLGMQDSPDIEVPMEILRSLTDDDENEAPIWFKRSALIILEMCAYAGSGNVIQVQKLLHLCAEHLNEEGLPIAEEEQKEETESAEGETEKDKTFDKEKAARAASHQSLAVLGIALITMGEPVGREMAQRTFQHLLQYGDLAVRRAVPLAMALSHISDPEYGMIDILSKLTHDADEYTAMSAIMALGLLSAGTTNAKVAQLLRSLATFYSKDQNILFVVRLAQGLLFAGKGLVTMAPYHSDRTLMSAPAISGILTVLVACMDFKNTILAEYHYFMYSLVAAIRPRMLMTLVMNESGELKPEKVKCRVGQALETVGQAGQPKKITGFQTQETPVLLNQFDRVELATDEYLPLTSVLEGLVILKKNPNATKADE